MKAKEQKRIHVWPTDWRIYRERPSMQHFMSLSGQGWDIGLLFLLVFCLIFDLRIYLVKLADRLTRPNILQFYSLKFCPSTFLSYMEFDDRRISRLWNCEMFCQIVHSKMYRSLDLGIQMQQQLFNKWGLISMRLQLPGFTESPW